MIDIDNRRMYNVLSSALESLWEAAREEWALAKECPTNHPTWTVHMTTGMGCSRIASALAAARKVIREG